MRVEEVVGSRMRSIREDGGQTQEQVGQAIGEMLGKPWPRQTVSAAEAGRRAFTAVELVAIARALNTNVAQLFTPSLDTTASIEIRPGVELDRRDVIGAMFESMDAAATRSALQMLIQSVQSLGTVSGSIRANAQFLLDHLAGVKQEAGES